MSVVVGAIIGCQLVIEIDTKYIPNDKQMIHTGVVTVTYMITLLIGESCRNTKGGCPGANAARHPTCTTTTASRVTPKVTDKTKEIQASVYPVYIAS